MRPRTTALVPLRALGVGKSRMASRLTPDQRAVLAEAMFLDVAASLAGSAVDDVVVAAGDDRAAAVARRLGLRAVLDPPDVTSLDAAIATALDGMPGLDGVLVVTADLPTLRADEIDEVVRLDVPVVVAPTHDGGTGALLRRPPGVVATAYGAGSAARHQRSAAAVGVPSRVVDLPGTRRDVDTWDDLAALPGAAVQPHTAAVLPDLLATVPTV